MIISIFASERQSVGLWRRFTSQLSIIFNGVKLVLGHILCVEVLPAGSEHDVADEEVLGLGKLPAALYDDLVTHAAIVLLVVAVEVLVSRDPETDLVVPMIAADSYCYGLVHSSLADDCAVELFAVGCELDESSTQLVR